MNVFSMTQDIVNEEGNTGYLSDFHFYWKKEQLIKKDGNYLL